MPGTKAQIRTQQAIADRLDALAGRHAGNGPALRLAVLEEMKRTLEQGRSIAERRLEETGRGLECARSLSALQDAMLRALYDFILRHVYPVQNPSAAEHMAMVAVGGYGRGALAPGSDIDLLFVLPYKQTPWGESVVEYLLYMLWDLGQKVGHATRTVDECIRLSRQDFTIATTILEARFLDGSQALFDSLVTRFDREVQQGTGPAFIEAKLAERDAHHRQRGESRYLVEPNVKDGKGGLRDLHTLFWIVKYFYRISSPAEMIERGVFSAQEMRIFRKCEKFLWSVRCNLHFLAGRAEERLTFDLQEEMARRLGYIEHPGLKDVERFMKHYFLIAKDVGDLTRIVCSALEIRHVKTVTGLSRFMPILRWRDGQPLKDAPRFTVRAGRLNVARDDVFDKDPVNLIRMFWLADKHGLLFHPEAVRLAKRRLKLIGRELRRDKEANRLFLEILCSRNDPETVLRRMNEAGVLGRFVPDFGRIVCMMQFSMYHHYTVDEHLLRSIGQLARIEHGEAADDHPLCHGLIHTLQNRRVLYVAMFLHDIAKGRPEDHSAAGARIARRLCPRLGLSAAETDTVAWLVEQHLTMSTVAQSRDLNDPKTIEDFAAIVQSPERLKLLLILTVADIKAVGPGVWNGWKGQLLRTLYQQCEPVLDGGHAAVGGPVMIKAAQDELRAALPGWAAGDLDAYMARHYAAYWLNVAVERKVAHAELIRQAQADGLALAVSAASDAFHDITELTVYAPDHPRLLSVIAGACAASAANIADAQIFTTTDGMALDSIFINRAFVDEADELDRGKRIASAIEKALRGEIRLRDMVARRARPKARLRAFKVEPQVFIANSWSDTFTTIEVNGLDRPGLLYDLTQALSDLNLNIASAHIATFGERAVDVFYVTDLTGQQIVSATRKAAIVKRLSAVLSHERERPARKGPAKAPAPAAAKV